MAKKKSGKKNSGSDFDNDMTRIEDLSSFLHKDDPEVEAFFKKVNLPDLPEIEELEQEPTQEAEADQTNSDSNLGFEFSEEPVNENFEQTSSFEPENDEILSFSSEENPVEISEESEFEQNLESDFETNESNDLSDDIFTSENHEEESPLNEDTYFSHSDQETTEDNSFTDDIPEAEMSSNDIFSNDFSSSSDTQDENLSEHQEPILEDENLRASQSQQISLHDLKNENIDYNQSTSFGHLPTSANPAFGLKLENLDPRYTDDIIEILEDFQLLKNNAEKDYRLSLNNGNLLISQINEFLTIQLASKLKRFGAHMIMGPSDLIFNSKIIKEKSPRGLHTKRFKDQSKRGSEELVAPEIDSNHDFYIHFQNTDLHFETENHLGAVTASQIIEEDDLKRSAHAQRMLDENTENISTDEKDLYQRYANLLEENKEKLINILKAKAILKNANSLSNLQFQINTQSIKNKNMIIIQAHANADIVKNKSMKNAGEETHES